MSTDNGVLVRIRDVEKTFRRGAEEIHVLAGLNLEVPAGEFLALMGPSGSGKSTLLNLIGGLDRPTRGAVEDLEISKIAPATATIKRYEDNNGTISAFLSGQVQLVATGNVVAAAILAKNPPKRPEVKFLIKDSPCFIGLNKGEPALLAAVNAAVAKAKKDGRLDGIAKKWLGAPLPAGF